MSITFVTKILELIISPTHRESLMQSFHLSKLTARRARPSGPGANLARTSLKREWCAYLVVPKYKRLCRRICCEFSKEKYSDCVDRVKPHSAFNETFAPILFFTYCINCVSRDFAKSEKQRTLDSFHNNSLRLILYEWISFHDEVTWEVKNSL